MINKWQMNRAGLFNFWYYDEETFQFANGKLLLRGSNGSGKSVTMQSFLPVLLDGKTSSDRLDPFGSKARRMEDYLLGEKEIVNRDERTGYLYMEFKRQDTEQYITIGIGLQAKRNKDMKFWGFVITDNRRIGESFELYKLEQNAGEELKIPLSRVELENAIGDDGGHVVKTKKDYAQLVNKYLFGFQSIEAYEDLIKLLIQLRSPKLSKDFKPTVIYEILKEALPPLSEDDLSYLSDTIEQMDQTKQQIEQIEREYSAITSLNQIYKTYNERHLADLAKEFIDTGNRLKKEEEESESLKVEYEKLGREIGELEEENRELLIAKKSNQDQLRLLHSHKVWDLQSELSEGREKLETDLKQLNKRRVKADELRRKKNEQSEIKNGMEEKISNQESSFSDRLIDMDNDAEEISFVAEHKLNRAGFDRNMANDFDFAIWTKEISNHEADLEKIKDNMVKFNTIKKEYQEKDKQLAEQVKLKDEASIKEREWMWLFEDDKEKKLDEIYQWVQDNRWLEIEEENLKRANQILFSLYEGTDFDELKAPFELKMADYQSRQLTEISELRVQEEQKKREVTEKEKELKDWKNKKDPEPALHPLTIEARDSLNEKGIGHVPFYAAVEFHANISPEVQRGLESSLIDSGMLDALITEEPFDLRHDRILTSNPQMMAHTLADYLTVDKSTEVSVSAERVTEILQSIIVAEDSKASISIQENGNYQLGLLKGHAKPVAEVRYIGRNARRKFRLEEINRMEEELVILREELREISRLKQKNEMELAVANLNFSAFPNDRDLKDGYEEIRSVRLEMEIHSNQITRLSDEITGLHHEYTEKKRLVDGETRNYDIESTLDAYLEAISISKRYRNDLLELDKGFIQYKNDVDKLKSTNKRLDELEQENLELAGEINVLEDAISIVEKKVEQIEIQLKKEGLEGISAQITKVQRILNDIESNLDDLKDSKPRKESERSYKKREMSKKKVDIEFWSNLVDVWESSFEEEANRGLVNVEQGGDTKVKAMHFLQEHGALLKEKERAKLSEGLTKEFFKQNSDLTEHRPNSFEVPLNQPEWMRNLNEDWVPFIEQWKLKNTRQIIELNYNGKQVTPHIVQQGLQFEKERQMTYLDSKDRELYEEILYNAVGNKLRARIRRAEKWIEKMKNLMETRDTSSGLSFSIRWKPRTADAENEMDTAELVELLRQDPKLLTEEALESITTHFRSKISRAKEVMDGGSEMQTLLQVLKEVLDYRKWFSFILYFQRENEPKRELTNNQFFKFSGGEKAMAMYIPLFTACYSRYQEAADDAPYIISLDEAFAGVDENNIREMFEIVEELDFNYIMNSQVLWGDYETIGQLAISELLRPKNADFVSVIRYYWDGNQRTEVTGPIN